MSLRSGKRDSHSENSRVLTLTIPGGKAMRRALRQYAPALLLALGLLAVPCTSAGQVLGSIAGNVKDTSGAVLPGVTVEAASPVLIEKVRTAVTDGSGQYSVTNLPPGNYTVTF